jgi:voltage-gated potassium channel
LIVATSDMDRNVAITLMAHSGNPTLRVIACAEDARRADLLRRAGATQVVVIDQLLADAIAAQLTAAG